MRANPTATTGGAQSISRACADRHDQFMRLLAEASRPPVRFHSIEPCPRQVFDPELLRRAGRRRLRVSLLRGLLGLRIFAPVTK